jgi:hypothetical protein
MTDVSDGSLGASPQQPKKLIHTLMAVDEHARPAHWCPNGHIIGWHVEGDEMSMDMDYLVRFTDDGGRQRLCPIDGLAEEVGDGC